MRIRFKILKTPDGSEPVDIRQLLIGLRLTAKGITTDAEYDEDGDQMIVGKKIQVYIVNYDYFLSKLKIHNIEAYQYFSQPQVKFRYPHGIYIPKKCCRK